MKKYDLKIANELLKEFISLTGFDLLSKKRRPEDAYIRCLFYKVLNKLNGMNDRMIADFLQSKGRKTSRVSIYQALKKVEIYYTNYKKFRGFYDVLFKDRVRDREKQELKEIRIEARARADKEKLRMITLSKMVSFVDSKRIEINNMIAEVPDDKIQEIRDLINLRIKSWSWKAKNEYEIIEIQ